MFVYFLFTIVLNSAAASTVLTKAVGRFQDATRKPSDSDLLLQRPTANLPLCLGECIKDEDCLTAVYSERLGDCHLYSSEEQVAELDSGQKAVRRGRTVREYGPDFTEAVFLTSVVDIASAAMGTTCEASSTYSGLYECEKAFEDDGYYNPDNQDDHWWLQINPAEEITLMDLEVCMTEDSRYTCREMTVSVSGGLESKLTRDCSQPYGAGCMTVTDLRGARTTHIRFTCDAECVPDNGNIFPRVRVMALNL